jgi:hypoxanthine phosphoribosyltransferase
LELGMSITATEAISVYESADCLFDTAAVETAIEKMATRLNDMLDGDQDVLALCVMTGGVILAGKLLPLLDAPLLIDYIHATRYRGATSGGELAWLKRPDLALQGRTVLIIDDILDEGYTLDAIVEYCRNEGAGRVLSAVLTEKQHDRSCGYQADVVGLVLPDRYVFGYGMDYKSYLRNVPGIYAVSEDTP